MDLMQPEIVVALLSLIGVVVAAWFSYITKRDTHAINKSVNHIQPGEKRLYQLAVEASLQLNNIDNRVSGMENKLDAHIKEVCPILEVCREKTSGILQESP